MNSLLWIAIALGLLVAGAALASLIDRRARWSNVPFDPDTDLDRLDRVATRPREDKSAAQQRSVDFDRAWADFDRNRP